jgi:tetratricopeptide (TPR) repeat protein|tara:strand:- start:1418 stop:4093 length:2676 start_codon:yes stop_codon:yes gene_type:complete
MKYIFSVGLGAIALLFFLWGCNPAKNTAINRFYHSTTAQYNGHFNANLLLDQAITGYRKNLKEDYYSQIPLELYPNEEDVKNLYPAIDTAIVKCTKVISDHSMPGAARPSAKKEENNSFIDENWTTIGKASYMRRDYNAAMKNFMFIKKFYSNDPSNYIGELWMAKTNIALKKYTEAGFNLDILEKALEAEAERGKKKNGIKKFLAKMKQSKRKRKKAKEEEVAKFPKKILFDYYKTRAELALIKEDKDLAIENLEKSLKETRKKPEKARVYFILGQLHQGMGNTMKAKENYSKVLKNNAPFEMEFSARMKRAFLGADAKLVKELKKMLRDAKNAEFKDQIYYALAQIDVQKGDEPAAFKNLTSSAFYSTSNNRQKAMSYEQMGDMKFVKRDYVPAQKYYDSCATVMPDTYPNFEAIKNKASKLRDLVKAVEIATFEDSVQRIANMDESDRFSYLEKVSQQLKDREAERKKKEAEKLLALQKNENAFNQNQSGNKWYFRNAKTRAEGLNEFKKQWGTRENEDDWRRADKIVFVEFSDNDSIIGDSASVAPEIAKTDPYSQETLMSDIPLTDSAMDASKGRLVKALYTVGLIYKDQLKEPELATTQFLDVLDVVYETDYKLMSAFQLYKMNETSNPTEAAIHKNYILNYFPNSDYANYLRDPDYFIKKKELDARAEKDYVRALDRYRSGLYYPALSAAEAVLRDEPTNDFRPKYLLLKAMCQGKLNEDKKTLLPTLTQLTKEFPTTDEAAKAQQMIDIINNGYSKNEIVDFSSKSIYTYDDKARLYVLIFLDSNSNPGLDKTRIVDFHREYFSRDKLKVTSKIYSDNQSIALVDDFDTEMKALNYLRVYKSTRKHLLDLQNAKTLIISQENLKILFQTQKLQEYENFYEDYY